MVNFVSPGVYVVEKDLSQYPTSVNPSVVGIVGFAGKGPENKATLITNQEQLVKTFGKPSELIEGQGLEAALEILEATNQVYYVRGMVESDAAYASATVPLGACPAVALTGTDLGVGTAATFVINVSSNDGVKQFASDLEVTIPAGTALDQTTALISKLGAGSLASKVSVQKVGSTTYIVGGFAGSGASLSVSCLDQGKGGISELKVVGSDGAPSGTAGGYKVASGFTVAPADAAYSVESLYRGDAYNYGLNTKGDPIGNTVEIDPKGGKDVVLQVNDAGAAEESYVVSLQGSGTFVEDVINTGEADPVSQYIQARITRSGADIDATGLPSFGNNLKDLGLTGTINGDAAFNPRFIKLVEGTYNMAGGQGGYTGTSSEVRAAAAGNAADKTGVHALDYDILNISMACVPDINDETVQNELITLAESSQNFLAVVAPPYGLASVQQAIDWSNGLSTSRTAAINTSWAAIYWPWVKTFDPYDQKDKWYDPAIYGVRQMCYTDSTSESWFAPAGFVRGRLSKPVDVEINVGQGDRDAMYSGGNAINPIVNFVQQGITIFGQRTAQRDPTALDRVNVRRLMIIIRKILLNSTRQFVFEPNDPTTWENITGLVESLLDEIARRRGITEFKVICDETTNTPVRIDKGELWCKVLLKPTKSAEIIVFELNLTNQSASL